jgi:lipopolysaccharide transport system ATP-binding protein
MGHVAIRVGGLSKRYRLGKPLRYKTFRDAIAETIAGPIRAMASRLDGRVSRGGEPRAHDHIWALKDVSFEVKRGEVLGIIGRNGAGKSTLLKILSRITEPTEGCAEVYGRTGALLEIGTGFHPELTGRENIYLNGAILGMKTREMNHKFDEIVAFAELEQFLDTPLKHYSTGMYIRLAFAIAAHLEPEILLIDEVLAVGDAAFQKKCLDKMGEIAKGGQTILFISHNLVAVQGLCREAVWLDHGAVLQRGLAKDVIASYLKATSSTRTEQVWEEIHTAPGHEQVRLRRVSVHPIDGAPSDPITVRTPFVMEFEYWNLAPGAHLNLSVYLYNEQGIAVFNTGPVSEPVWHGRAFPAGLFRSLCYVPGDLLNEGTYRILVLIIKDLCYILHQQEDVLVFNIIDSEELRGRWYGKWQGVIRPHLQWRTELLQAAPLLVKHTHEP